MNHRRGLRRVYAVLTVIWIAGVLLAVLSGRWQPWQAKLLSSVETSQPREFTVSPEDYLAHPDFYNAQTMRRETTRKWIWAVSLSIIPPLVFYFLLFYVARWIYRGFRPGTQI